MFWEFGGVGQLPDLGDQGHPEASVVGGWSCGGCLAHWGPVGVSLVFLAGSTPFPYNPLIMRLQAGVMASPPPPGLPAGSGPLAGPHHAWDEEPKPLLCEQYETLSDSE